MLIIININKYNYYIGLPPTKGNNSAIGVSSISNYYNIIPKA